MRVPYGGSGFFWSAIAKSHYLRTLGEALFPEPSIALVLVALAVLAGAFVQANIGFGLGLVASTALMLAYPDLMPGAMIMIGGAMAIAVLASDWRSVDWPGVGWATAGRVPGLMLGTWLVVIASVRLLSVFVGVAVVLAAVLQASRWAIPKTRLSLAIAGFVSGTTGTVSGIGGPPVGMVYASEPGPQVRATLSVYFIIGTATSLLVLGLAGQLAMSQVGLLVVLLPALVLGMILARPLAPVIDARYTRSVTLIVAGIAGALLVVTSVLS